MMLPENAFVAAALALIALTALVVYLWLSITRLYRSTRAELRGRDARERSR